MAYFGVDLDCRIQDLNHQFKNTIRSRGGIGIRSLGVIFRQMDNNGNRKLDAGEFEQALATFGQEIQTVGNIINNGQSVQFVPKEDSLQALMKYYDIDGDGNVCYEEFLRGLRDELTDRKKKMVEKAFNFMDKDKTGSINIQDIINTYDVSKHKDFISQKKSREDILMEFLNSFDGMKGNNDGVISRQEWFDYYTDLAMSTPNDEYFVKMMESTWCMAEDEGNSIFQDKVKQLISLMRQRLMVVSNNSQEEFVLRKIFKDYDTNGSGSITIDELAAMLAKLGISVERQYIQAMIRELDKNNTGMLEFEEFATFLLYDPYK